VEKHGVPTRRSGFVRWETKAESFAQRGRHVLLFSPAFIEVREVNTGRLVQVLEGEDIRLLHPGSTSGAGTGAGQGVLVAMRSGADTSGKAQVEKVVELLQTAEIVTPGPAPVNVQAELWREWDMAV
jgi:RHO1 GDP-GTP exchange protein 1/2